VMAGIMYSVSTRFEPLLGFPKTINFDVLAKDFSLSQPDVDLIKGNHSSFKSTGLHHLIAQELMRAFQRAGVKAEMQAERVDGKTPENEVIQNGSVEFMTCCPKCNTRVRKKSVCPECGLFFNKFFKRTETYPEPDLKHEPDEGDFTRDTNMKNARRFLGVATALYMTQFTLDGPLGNILYRFLSSDIDHGNIGFILGTLFLTVGVSFIARAKGYHPALGIIGLSSLPGLSCMLLLPDRNSDDQPALLSLSRLSAVGFLVVSFFWFSSMISGNSLRDDLLTQAGLLSNDRFHYPAEDQNPINTEIRSEVVELTQFIDEVSWHLTEESLSANNAALVVDEVMKQSADLLVWVDYQHYLQTKADPDQLDFQNKNELELDILRSIKHLQISVDPSDPSNGPVRQVIYENLNGEAGNRGKTPLQMNREALLGKPENKIDQINEALYLVANVVEAKGRTGRWDIDTSYVTRRDQLQNALAELPAAFEVEWTGDDTVVIDIQGNWMPNKTHTRIVIKYFASAFTEYGQQRSRKICTIVHTNLANKLITSKSKLNAFDVYNLIRLQ
jgi:hypothetical protein